MATRTFIRDWRGRFAKVPGSKRKKRRIIGNRHSAALKADITKQRSHLAAQITIRREQTAAPRFAYKMAKMDELRMAETSAWPINSPERKKWITGKWSKKTKEALHAYQGSSRELNGHLRGRTDKDFDSSYIRQRVKRDVPAIDEAIFSHRLDRDVVAHRVTRTPAIRDDILTKSEWKNGTVRDRGYMGVQRYHPDAISGYGPAKSGKDRVLGFTSSAESLISSFGAGTSNDRTVHWVMTIPKGTHCVEIDNNLESGIGDEGEILLPREFSWKIDKLEFIPYGSPNFEGTKPDPISKAEYDERVKNLKSWDSPPAGYWRVHLSPSRLGITNRKTQERIALQRGQEWIFGLKSGEDKELMDRVAKVKLPVQLDSSKEVGYWLHAKHQIEVDEEFYNSNIASAKTVAEELDSLLREYPDIRIKQLMTPDSSSQSNSGNSATHNMMGEAIPSEGTMRLNGKWLKLTPEANRDSAMTKANAHKGFHPKGAEQNPIRSTLIHEFGHFVADKAFGSEGMVPTQDREKMIAELFEEYKHQTGADPDMGTFSPMSNEANVFVNISDKEAFHNWVRQNTAGYAVGGEHMWGKANYDYQMYQLTDKLKWDELVAEAFLDAKLNGDSATPVHKIVNRYMHRSLWEKQGKLKKADAKNKQADLKKSVAAEAQAELDALEKDLAGDPWGSDAPGLEPMVFDAEAGHMVKASKATMPQGDYEWEQDLLPQPSVPDYDAVYPTTPPKNKPNLPEGHELTYEKQAGGSHGAAFYKDTQGRRWLVKKQKKALSLTDNAVAAIQTEAGLRAPLTYETIINGDEVHVREVVGDIAFHTHTPDPTNFTQQEKLDIMKQHVIDWLVANHDAHGENWVYDEHGHLMGIDKTQAFKWYGKDKLAWDWRPNEHDSIYNQMWKRYIAGDIQITDDMQVSALSFADQVTNIPDNTIRDLIRPYAEEAAKIGKLVTAGGNAWGDPIPGTGTIEPNNVEQFIEEVVFRKNILAKQFAQFFNRAKKARHTAYKSQEPPWETEPPF